VFRQPFEIKIDIGDGEVETRHVIHNYAKIHSQLRKITVESCKKLVDSHFNPLYGSSCTVTTDALSLREYFLYHFNSTGYVPWQEEAILHEKC
jgi:hypothetical protein